MKRSIILLSVLFTGLCNNLVYSAQSAAASTNSSAPAATPNRKVARMPGLFDQGIANAALKLQAEQLNEHKKTPMRVQSPRVTLITHKKLTAEEHAEVSQAVANQAAHLAPSRTMKFMRFAKQYRLGFALAGIAALVCGLTLGETKYKMVSRFFKKAPAAIPAKAVKVSWLKALTGLATR